jgi:hypothetical protein
VGDYFAGGEGGRMTAEEIARKLAERDYAKLCGNARSKKESELLHSPEDYWERNKNYFIERAKIYLEVRECLEKEGK